MSDSSLAKLAVVVGIGAAVLGLVTLKSRLSPAPVAPHATPAVLTASPEPPPSPSAPAPAPSAAAAPTAGDRHALAAAVAAGDRAQVEALFAKGVSLAGTLGSAASTGNAGLVEFLLGHGVSASEDEEVSVPPLLAADDSDAVVSALLAKGAKEPTLARAVAAGAPHAVARILAKGGSADAKSTDGEPVLMAAVRDSAGPKRRAIVDALLKAGADPNAKHEDDTALGLAVTQATLHLDAPEAEKEGDRAIDIVTRLVARKARVDGDALTAALPVGPADAPRRAAVLDALLAGTLDRAATARAVATAVERRDAASVRKLAAKGVTWSAFDAHSPPPLATAIVASDVAMVKALLDANAPTDKLGENGDSALLAAVAAAAGDSEDALRVVRTLLEHGVSPNKRGRDGRTALYAAAQQGSETLVALLVAKGARVDDAVDGMTPYEAADTHGYEAVTKVLKARGAKVTTKRPD